MCVCVCVCVCGLRYADCIPSRRVGPHHQQSGVLCMTTGVHLIVRPLLKKIWEVGSTPSLRIFAGSL